MNIDLNIKEIGTLVFLILSIGVGSCQQSTPLSNPPKETATEIAKKGFDVLFEIEQQDQDIYNLSVTIELDSNNYIISPFSTDSIYGHFRMSLAENNYFIPNGELQEAPLSVEEFDPIITWPVRFVRETTTYTQQLQRIAQDDFTVKGLVEFLLEPSCVPYDVTFEVAQRTKSLQVEKERVFVSAEYKR